MRNLSIDRSELENAASKAYQAEIVLRLMSQYPSKLPEVEIEALIGLLLSLVGNAASYLTTEQIKQEASHA